VEVIAKGLAQLLTSNPKMRRTRSSLGVNACIRRRRRFIRLAGRTLSGRPVAIHGKCYSESVTVADPASRKYPINTYGKGAYVNARYRVRTCDPYRVKVVLYH
jgi:hypothetical protein